VGIGLEHQEWGSTSDDWDKLFWEVSSFKNFHEYIRKHFPGWKFNFNIETLQELQNSWLTTFSKEILGASGKSEKELEALINILGLDLCEDGIEWLQLLQCHVGWVHSDSNVIAISNERKDLVDIEGQGEWLEEGFNLIDCSLGVGVLNFEADFSEDVMKGWLEVMHCSDSIVFFCYCGR